MSFHDILTDTNAPVQNALSNSIFDFEDDADAELFALFDEVCGYSGNDSVDSNPNLSVIFDDDCGNIGNDNVDSGNDSDKALLDVSGSFTHANEVTDADNEANVEVLKQPSAFQMQAKYGRKRRIDYANNDKAIAIALNKMSAFKIFKIRTNLKSKYLNINNKCEIPTALSCKKCNTTFIGAHALQRHLSSANHRTAIQASGLTNKDADCQIYECALCDFTSRRKDGFHAHLDTAKHKYNAARDGR